MDEFEKAEREKDFREFEDIGVRFVALSSLMARKYGQEVMEALMAKVSIKAALKLGELLETDEQRRVLVESAIEINSRCFAASHDVVDRIRRR